MDSWQVLWANRVLWIGFSMIFLVVQTHLLYCMYQGENGVYIAVWPSCQTDDHQQDHIFCKGSWDTYYTKLHFPIVLSEGWSTCYPVPSLLGYCRCLQGFVCLSFLALVSISGHFNLLTILEAGLASPSQPEQRPQQLQQPQAQQQLQKLYTTTFGNTMNVPYGRSRNAFEWTLQLENTQVSGAASSKGAWLGLGGPSDFRWKVPTGF